MLVSSKRSSIGQYYKVEAPEKNGCTWDNGFKILGQPKCLLRFSHKMVQKAEQTFWPAQYLHQYPRQKASQVAQW